MAVLATGIMMYHTSLECIYLIELEVCTIGPPSLLPDPLPLATTNLISFSVYFV